MWLLFIRSSFCLLLFSVFIIPKTSAQEVIEIDTITSVATKGLPYNKPFTLKVPIDADDVTNIYFIKKYKYHDLANSIEHWVKKGGGRFIPTEITKTYYYVRKISEKNFLFISFADKYLLEPSSSYYVIIDYKKAGPSVNSFFDNYYKYKIELDGVKKAEFLTKATESLRGYEEAMKRVFGDDLIFGNYNLADFNTNLGAFDIDFTNHLLTPLSEFDAMRSADNISWNGTSGVLNGLAFNFDSLTFKILLKDTLINKEALTYITSKDNLLNDLLSDFESVHTQSRFLEILSGISALNCIFCDKVNGESAEIKDLTKRVTNIDASITVLNNLRRALALVRPPNEAASNINVTISDITRFINELQKAKGQLKKHIGKRKEIETLITTKTFNGFNFKLSTVVSGNSYLNFETRNKVLLTPDFGIVTSALTKKAKQLEYGIVPYLGFHINFMAVDKDITFSSYKKNWKQYFSFMVGWSLVNMNQTDSSYTGFFEKSSLLTGFGYRINNVIRLSAGTQWLFKQGINSNNNPTKKLAVFPYVGISIDLNVKQYLNGFVDLLSGIGKTKTQKPGETSSQ